MTDGELAIAKRAVTLTSESGHKPYDGTALTKPDVAVGGDGFVSGEASDIKATGSVTNVSEGKVSNAITFTEGDKFKGSNYDITKTEGELWIDQSTDEVVVTVAGHKASATYNGEEHSVSGYDIEASSDLYNVGTAVEFTGKAEAAGTDADTYGMGLSADQFENTDGNFSKVTFKVTDGELAIAKRDAAVSTLSASKYYDGEPLMAGGSIDLVLDETATAVTSDSQTEVGSTLNKTYKVEWNGTAKSGNYNVLDGEFGTLTVKAQSIVPDPENPESYKGVQIGDLSDLVYNGKSQEQKPTVTNKEGVALIEGVDYEISFSDDTVNAGTVTVTVSGIGNYTGVATRIYQITPAPYTVVTDSAEKVYNGEPLTAGGKIEGIVDGEDADFEVTGSQTEVGTSANTYVVKWNKSAKQSNYEFKGETLGTLTVTAPAPAAEDNTPAPEESNDVLAKTSDSTLIYGVCAAAAVAALVAIVGAFAMRRRSRGEERR